MRKETIFTTMCAFDSFHSGFRIQVLTGTAPSFYRLIGRLGVVNQCKRGLYLLYGHTLLTYRFFKAILDFLLWFSENLIR